MDVSKLVRQGYGDYTIAMLTGARLDDIQRQRAPPREPAKPDDHPEAIPTMTSDAPKSDDKARDDQTKPCDADPEKHDDIESGQVNAHSSVRELYEAYMSEGKRPPSEAIWEAYLVAGFPKDRLTRCFQRYSAWCDLPEPKCMS